MSLGRNNYDPTDFDGTYPVPGILPVVSGRKRKETSTNAATAAQAAGVRAFTAQAVAFYFRAPVKAFFRTRVDYLAYARNLQQKDGGRNDATWRRLSWLRSTTPGVVASAVRVYGWKVIPEQILPPLIANVSVGAVLYTSYLQILGLLHEESSHATKRVYPPPAPYETLAAGFMAGGIQSLVAAPLDAIQVRYERHDPTIIHGKQIQPQSMWQFGRDKLHEIGARGVFAGYTLSALKDSLGAAVFFSTFEYVKAQAYYNFLQWFYGGLGLDTVDILARRRPTHKHQHDKEDDIELRTIKPHYAIEPAFLFLAGFSASITQQSILYPLHHIQVEHWEHLETLDEHARAHREPSHTKTTPRAGMMQLYYKAYQDTLQHCKQLAVEESGGNLRRWLYRGFWWNTIRQVPSTSAGLIIFELMRRKYGLAGDDVRISRDGYDILLT